MAVPNLDKLKSQLQTSGIQQTNIALFQVISQLIDAVRQFQGNTITEINNSGGNITSLLGRTYITVTDETSILINSRQLIAGDNITLNIASPGEIEISATGGNDHVVLADGGDNPTLGVGDGAGGFIYTAYTP